MLTEAVFEEIVRADTCPRSEPVITTGWFNGLINEEVNALEALVTVPVTKEEVDAKEAVVAKGVVVAKEAVDAKEAVAAIEALCAVICKPFI